MKYAFRCCLDSARSRFSSISLPKSMDFYRVGFQLGDGGLNHRHYLRRYWLRLRRYKFIHGVLRYKIPLQKGRKSKL